MRFLLLLFCFISNASASLFSTVFSNHMVLQRAPKNATVYGNATMLNAGKNITIKMDGRKVDGPGNYIHFQTIQVWSNGLWKAVLPARHAGGPYIITATVGTNTSNISNVMYGEVFFCSGQSNMWLPVQYTFPRNDTIKDVENGMHQNIRLLTYPTVNLFHPNWVSNVDLKWEFPTNETVWKFSAACWYFAINLNFTEQNLQIGLLNVAAGGTSIESWVDPAISKGECSELTACDAYNCTGGLHYGMVTPFVNMTVKMALWYQGENNVGECCDPSNPKRCHNLYPNGTTTTQTPQFEKEFKEKYSFKKHHFHENNNSPFLFRPENDLKNFEYPFEYKYGGQIPPLGHLPGYGGPSACGNVLTKTNYACAMPGLIRSWREMWGEKPEDFAFAIVTLAAWGSEGDIEAIGPFRIAQTGSYGYAPNPVMPNTVIVQGFDISDPWTGHCATFDPRRQEHDKDMTHVCDGDVPWSVTKTPYFMGPIHSRLKGALGWRLATQIKALVYDESKTLPISGPIFKGCDSNETHVILKFDTSLSGKDEFLMDDYESKFPNMNASALEIQVNGDLNTYEDITGQWHTALAYAGGANEVIVDAAYWTHGKSNLTGIRYAWADTICCGAQSGRMDQYEYPCPPHSCPIKLKDSNLPAPPFIAQIVNGKCRCVPPAVCDS